MKSRRSIVSKYLVVANQTLGGEHLMDEVRRRAAAGPSSFYIVVPNTHSGDARASGAPLTAIGDALAVEEFDEIIISTLPSGISRWLGMDLPSRAERKFKLPVTTVTARP